MHTVTERGCIFLSKNGAYMAKKSGMKMPDDFCNEQGWCRANNYGLREEDFETRAAFNKERFRRSTCVMRAYCKTDEYKASASIVRKELWEERVAAAKRTSDTTEVLLLESLTRVEDGSQTTSEMVANCINNIARELSKRGCQNLADMELKDLVTISNTLIGLMKTASASKKDQGWKPQVQVNNLTVNNSSKTGGVVGGLEDVIDLRGK